MCFLHPKLTPIVSKEQVQSSDAVHGVALLSCLNDKQLLQIFLLPWSHIYCC